MTQVIFIDTSAVDVVVFSQSIMLSIGNFDGVHYGHRTMLCVLKRLSTAQNMLSAVMMFEPQPKEFFLDDAPARLSSFNEKIAHFNALGIDVVFVAKFTKNFSALSAQKFCKLLQNIGTKALVLGADFRFGADRKGNIAFLQAYFSVHMLKDITQNGARVSSTNIRKLLSQGDVLNAKNALGYLYHITGRVVDGDKIGRVLGFATANVALVRKKPAVHGVWGVAASVLGAPDAPIHLTNLPAHPSKNHTRTHPLMHQNHSNDAFAASQPATHSTSNGLLLPNGAYFGCANIGKRPAVNLGNEWRLEVHLPSFSGDLYGKILCVHFLHFLHDERNYKNIEALKQGIAQDVDALIDWYHHADFAPFFDGC